MIASAFVGKRLSSLLVAVFIGLSCATLAMWKHDNALSVTGDEPPYLVIASGLLPHFEVEQTGLGGFK